VTAKNNLTGEEKSFLFKVSERSIFIDALNENDLYAVTIKANSLRHRLFHIPRSLLISPLENPPSILIIGSGRSGTTSLARYLDGLEFKSGKKISSRHETLFEYILPAIASEREEEVICLYSGFRHNVESAPHFSSLAGKLPAGKIVHIIRDGRRVVQSGLNRGWYQKDDMWEKIKPKFDGSLFEKCCKFWVYQIEQAEQHATKTVRLEDLVSSRASLADLLDYLEIKPSKRELPKANTGNVSSSFQQWTKEQRDTFIGICGEVMDIYYNSWRTE
jgi:hypothetical protein